MKKAPAIVVGIDLGNSSLKAVRLQKKGNQYVLARVALLPNPRNPQDQAIPTEQAVKGNRLHRSSIACDALYLSQLEIRDQPQLRP